MDQLDIPEDGVVCDVLMKRLFKKSRRFQMN